MGELLKRSTIFRFHDFTLDSEGPELWLGSNPLEAAPRVVQLLLLLVEHPQQVVSKDKLFAALWPTMATAVKVTLSP